MKHGHFDRDFLLTSSSSFVKTISKFEVCRLNFEVLLKVRQKLVSRHCFFFN